LLQLGVVEYWAAAKVAPLGSAFNVVRFSETGDMLEGSRKRVTFTELMVRVGPP
jgi:hypothetical protein